MKLIKLTAVAHPDINNGKPRPVFLNPEHIVMFELGKHEQERWGWREERMNLTNGLWEEVRRVVGEASAVPNLAPESQEEANRVTNWVRAKEAASSLQAAYGLITQQVDRPSMYPPIEATAIQLAVPNARFTMLPICYVQESPEEVARLIEEKA